MTLVRAKDSAFRLVVLTGSAPSVSAVIATVTFGEAFSAIPHFSVTPANGNAAALSGTSAVTPDASTTIFTLTAGSAALGATTTYEWEIMLTP